MAKKNGFSLLELLVVIVIIFILAAITVPNLVRTLSIYRVKGSAEGLASQLNLARQQAIGQGRPIAVFIDPSNSKIYVDLNRNGVPEGARNTRVINRSTINEEYILPPSITLSLGGAGCFSVPSNIRGVINPNTMATDPSVILAPNDSLAAPELGIANYNNWNVIIFDSRGELQLEYRQGNTICMNNNLGSNPSGAVLISCKQVRQNIKFTLSISLRGGVSVLTY